MPDELVTAIPISRIAVWPARGTSAELGSVIEPTKLGSVEVVTKSPTIFVSLAGASMKVPEVTIGGVVLMMKVS